jgi:hypothetical protein
VGRKDDGLALGGQPADLLPEQVPGCDIEGGRGLVEEQQIRVTGDGEREVEPLLLAAGELTDPVVALLQQVGAAQDVLDAERVGVVVADQVDGLGNGEGLGGVALLEHRPDPGPAGLGVGVGAEDPDAALGRRAQAEQHLDGRRLAGAVGAEDGDDVALPDGQVEVVDGDEISIALGQPGGVDNGGRGHVVDGRSGPAAGVSAGRHDLHP